MSATPITVLGLETSCDETAAAIVRLTPDDAQAGGVRGDILSNVVLSQIELHAPYGGVVPELAARAHIDHLDRLVADALAEAGCNLEEMDAIAATAGPGLIGGVLIGLTTGKALALACGAPFYGINHLEGHALTARLTHDVAFPYLLLLVSGGHCQLSRVDGVGDYALLGTTRDDAVGEAFDKAAKLLGLGYPGGPEIETRAARGDASRFALPRPLVGHDDSGCDFSFSGLKTALRHCAIELQPISETDICDLAAGFQTAIADCLTDRCRAAIKEFSPSASDAGRLIVAGGVAANQFLRHALDGVAVEAGFTLTVPPPALCTDNAAMIAWAGAERLHAGSASDAGLAVPARARWPLSENPL
ncbi:MAG: tRNA (adenosine(37)-N6)-threonylcarbamoyltransferase complex transferase subunit TsaD [Parvibaculales bacterium]